tara:strand:+ start:1294 stop:2175 length:882 start_codon:yes stop_codon:yes gene_type:complete
MSRNRQRAKIQQSKKEQQPPPRPEFNNQNDNPFGLSFVVATEIVKLPSEGKFYHDGSPLKGVTELEVKSVTAAEEDILINESYINEGIVFDKLIDSIMITPGVKCSDLIDCDKMAVLISARKTGYGDEVEISNTCNNCGHNYLSNISMQSILDKDHQKDERLDILDIDWEHRKDSNTFYFKLPSTSLEVDIKILTKIDQEILEQTRKQREKINLPFNETIEFLRATIVAVNGITDPAQINKLVEVLPAADARKIRLVHNLNLPKLNMMHDFVCPKCNTEQKEEVPFSLGWFWS